MKFKDMKQVEHTLLFLSLVVIVTFTCSYFIHFIFFYGFLTSLAALLVVWIGYWKCPHCGKNLWYNFDAPCRGCGKNIFEKPEEKPKNIKENTGFFF